MISGMDIVDSLSGLEKLRTAWNNIKDANINPLLRWEWIFSAASSFYPEANLRLLHMRIDGKTAAIAPMVESGSGFGKRLTFIGADVLQEPCGFPSIDTNNLLALIDELLCSGRVIILENCDTNSEALQLIFDRSKGMGIFMQKSTGGTCYLPTKGLSYEQFIKSLPSKRRYDLNRLYKRVSLTDGFRCEIFNPAKDDLQSVLDTVFEIEANNWKGQNGSAIKFNPKLTLFFRTFCQLACEADYLRIGFLQIQGHKVAVLIGAELGNRFWVFKIGYDQKWSRYSPGLLLINETVKHAFNKKLDSYEFLGSNESWIHLWTGKDNLRPKKLVAFYPYNLKGAIGISIDAGRIIFRRIINLLK